jgi:biotin carboxylase
LNKNILLLGAGAEQCIAIRKAQALGYTVIACDGNSEAPGLEIADRGVTVDIRDATAVISLCKEFSVDGVFCHAVEIPEVVAEVAERLHLPGLSRATAQRCTHKPSRVKALRDAGVPVAGFVHVPKRELLLECAEGLGFPLVIKPVDNAGSRGVRLVAAAEELLPAYEEALAHSRSPEVLLESVLSGPQISTESVVYDGRVHTFAFADRNYENSEIFAPYFIEDGINYPSVLSGELQLEVVGLVERTIRALQIDFGAAKGDIIIHDGVPHVIEMACRTSGGWFGAGSVPAATGVDPLAVLLTMAVGERPDMTLLRPTRALGCAQRYWIPRRQETFVSVSGFDKVGKMPGVVMFNDFFPPPGTQLEKARHHAQRYAQVICTAANREEAIACADAAIDAIIVNTVSV